MIFLSFWYQKKISKNKYISKHEKKIINDKEYNDYLNWCLSKNEIPMDKEIFLKEVEKKEILIKNLYK